MRILVAGDTGGDIHHCRYLIRTAEQRGTDRIFVLGDFDYASHREDGRRFIRDLDNLLAASQPPVTLYWLDGNHDKISHLQIHYPASKCRDGEGFIQLTPRIRYSPRGHRFTWDGATFITLGGAYSVDKKWRLEKEAYDPVANPPESWWYPEEEMTDFELRRILDRDSTPVDVILAHDKPRCSVPGWNREDILECLPNQDRLQQAVAALTPQAFLHGHLHYRYDQLVDYGTAAGAMATMVVRGLGCNAGAMEHGTHEQNQRDSWHIVDTHDVTL